MSRLEGDLGVIIPRARDYLVETCRGKIGPQLRTMYQELQDAQRIGRESNIVVAEKKRTNEVPSEVTKADRTIDGQLRNAWQAIFGNTILWYSEESKAGALKRLKPEELLEVPLAVVVDPIDGSGRLARFSDRFSNSFALVARGTTVLGVIYQPVTNTLWVAERDKPTVRIDRDGETEIKVSETSKLEKAYVSTAFAWNLGQRMQNMKIQRRLGPFVNQFVSTASSVLDIVDIAQAHIDALVCLGLHPWDMAASAFAVVQSGGKVTKFTGDESEWHPFQPEIVASNGLIHGELIKVINSNALLNAFLETQRILTRRDISREKKEWVVFRAAKKARETVIYLAKKTRPSE